MRHVIFITLLYAVLSPWAEQNRGNSQSIHQWATNISESYKIDLVEETFIQLRSASHRLNQATVSLLAEITDSQ